MTDSKESWLAAYKAFLKSDTESRFLKTMPLILIGFGPLDDLILPFAGLLDDIPTAIVAIVILAVTYLRVKKYR